MQSRPRMRRAGLAVWIVAAAGCASIPPEAPELSGELGNRLGAMEAAHLALLRAYFDERRDRVDEFVAREWVPLFTREVFAEPAVQDMWVRVAASTDDRDRAEFMARLAPRIQERVAARSRELHSPLDEIELAMERRLRDEYAQARAINNSITTFLVSASDVAESRSRYLDTFGATDQSLADLTDRVDRAVSALSRARQEGESVAARTTEYLGTVQDILARLTGEAETGGGPGEGGR